MIGRNPRSRWATPVVSEPLVQVETGAEPTAATAEPMVETTQELTVAPQEPAVAPEPSPEVLESAAIAVATPEVPTEPLSNESPATAETTPIFNPAALAPTLEKAGLELVQTRADLHKPVETTPIRLGRPRKAVTKITDDVLVQVETQNQNV